MTIVMKINFSAVLLCVAAASITTTSTMQANAQELKDYDQNIHVTFYKYVFRWTLKVIRFLSHMTLAIRVLTFFWKSDLQSKVIAVRNLSPTPHLWETSGCLAGQPLLWWQVHISKGGWHEHTAARQAAVSSRKKL